MDAPTARRLRDRVRSASLRTRILVATGVLATVALLVAVLAYAVTLDGILYASALDSATADASQTATLVLDKGQDPGDVLALLPDHGAVVQLLDPAGRVLVSSDESAGAAGVAVTSMRPAAGQTQTAQVVGIPGNENDPYAVVARGLARPTRDGATVLAVAAPLQVESGLVKGATTVLALIALVLLGGLLWLISRVLRSALGRVEDIRSSVADIRASDRRARVSVPPGDDEITRLARTMNDLLDRLDEADAAQRAFVSNASHELRSPLTTIRMITELSPDGIGADDTRVVSGETLRMQKLVDDLLTLAKADDRGLTLEARDVDLDDLLAQEARRVRLRGDLRVETSFAATRTTGDPQRLTQVVRNIVDNAMRHADSTVRLACRVEGQDAVVTVDNDGEPVPLADRRAVFDRFARLQASRDRDSGGSGLGLSIVRALVTAHGGTVVADEAPDGWCRFEVRLPAQVPDPADELDDELDDLDDELDGVAAEGGPIPAQPASGSERSR